MPDQSGDEIDLGELFSRLASQWKLILGITLGGTLLAVIFALSLPKVYQPSVTVSRPSQGNVSQLATINKVLKSENTEDIEEQLIPATPQEVFNEYFDHLRSQVVFSEYVQSEDYLAKLYPDKKQSDDQLLSELTEGFKIVIEEPSPDKKGAYIENPIRVRASLEIQDEAIGVELLNGYTSYVNQRLVQDLEKDTWEIVANRIVELTKTLVRLREQHEQDRLLTIQRMEDKNAEKIVQLEDVIKALLVKAKAERETRIAEAEEALQIAKSLNITNPTTLEALALRGQKGQVASTTVTVGEEQTSSLYLQGSKYLGILIETLKNRKSDERFLSEINDLREKISLIKNDPVLAALKARETDDPWIKGLPEKLADLDILKTLSPDISGLIAYGMEDSAIVSDKAIKPNRKLIVLLGIFLSFFISIVLVLIVNGLRVKKG
jgi:LPS O-antigen subunit length determinant protein (WzzB/FepE family)